jgi:arsenite methyltransferase
VSGGVEFDEATARRLERMYGGRQMVERRGMVRAALRATPGDRIVDVGCGPGFYVAELAAEVGPSGSVVGVDASPDMLGLARSRCAGLANVELRQGDATDAPLEPEAFDAAVSVQVLEYVPDTASALAVMWRSLMLGGRVVVWDTDWATVSWHSNDAVRMARVLRAFDEHLAHPSLPRTLAPQLRAAGFSDVGFTGHSTATAELTAGTVAGSLVGLIASFVPGHCGVTRDEATEWAAEQRALAEQGDAFFACTQFCFTATKH